MKISSFRNRHKSKFALLAAILITVFLTCDDVKADGKTPAPPEPPNTGRTDSFTLAPFGKLHVYLPTGTPKSVTLMVSGDAGWKYGVDGFAKTFAGEGSLVAGVDILQYYKSLRANF